MKKTLLLFLAMLLLMGARTAVDAQELTVSDIQDSGCQRGTRAQANEREKRWTIILTKEGDILTVQLLGFIANCAIAGFDVTPSMSGGSDGTPYSVSIGVEPIEFEVQATCVCPYNVSFTVHGLETNSFSFSCWWYNGQVTLTEGEPLTLGSITEYVTIDSYIYFIDKVSHTASFVGLDAGVTMGSGALKDVSIPSETDYEGQKYMVTSIGEGTLMGHSRITSLTIPESVTSIKDYALTYCSSLKDVYCYAENVPQTGDDVFVSTPISSATLHVPTGSLEKYKTTSPWSEFGSIVALPETNTFIQDIAWVDGFGYEQDGQYKLDNVELFYYSVAGDTLINSKNYFRIQRNRICKTHCELEVDEYSCETEEDTLCFFMREDAAGDVWFYTEDKNVFEKISHNTLYNDYNLADDLICRDLFLFNVKKKYAIGETLPLGMIALDSPNGFREGQDYWDIYPYEVKSIDEMSLLDGKTYKLYNDYILEGIGPLNGPLIGIGTSNSYGLDFNQLFAFYRDGQLIYRNEGYLSALEEHFPNILDIVTGKRQNDPDDNTTDSLYGEWWLVGWNDGGDWFEVDTNYVSHQSLSIELKDKKEGPSMAYSMANVIIVGLLTLNGNEMTFEEGGWYTSLYCGFEENDFFEDHICKIKSYQLEGSQLRLYYTDEDYFVFTNDFDDSEEHFYEWKYGPADPYIAEVITKSDTEVDVKIIDSPTSAIGYSRTRPPRDSSDICHFAPSDLADQSFEVGDKVAFRIVQFKRLKVEEGKEYELKVEPISGSGHITNRTGIIHNDQRMGWIIADGEQGDTYYYPLKKLAEKYLVEGLPVKVSGELYSTWRTPWESQGHPTGYYLSIDFLTSAQYNDPVTFTKDLMATIILPTEPDASKGKYYKLDRCEDGQIIFEQELQPQARVPYVIVPNEDFTIDPSTLNLEGLTQDEVSIEGVSFIGSYHREELPALTGGDGEESSYIDLIDTTSDCGVTISAETGKEVLFIGALRAYLIVSWDDPINPGGARSPKDKLEIVLKDHKTGVGDAQRLNDKGQMKNDIYNLAGQRVDNSKLPRGIYIEDKKKVFKK